MIIEYTNYQNFINKSKSIVILLLTKKVHLLLFIFIYNCINVCY